MPDITMDLTAKDVAILREVKETHCIEGHYLPLIWEDPAAFLVPSNDKAFVVKRCPKNITIVTDGAICVKMKPLSDRRHFAIIAEYSNGKSVNPAQLLLRCGPMPIISDDDDPRLWQVAFNRDVNPGDKLTFRYNDKRVEFTL